jgi:hypothetical protein
MSHSPSLGGYLNQNFQNENDQFLNSDSDQQHCGQQVVNLTLPMFLLRTVRRSEQENMPI